MRLVTVAFALACSRAEPPADVLAVDSSLVATPTPAPVARVRAPVAAEAPALGAGTDADPPPSTPAVRIPPYTVVFHQRMISPPGVLVEVVVPSLSRRTPQQEVARIAEAILRGEAGDRLIIYSTHAAFRANEDADYGRRHPRALADGYLGRVENGAFRPPPDWLK
jgi:hypothetical protein